MDIFIFNIETFMGSGGYFDVILYVHIVAPKSMVAHGVYLTNLGHATTVKAPT